MIKAIWTYGYNPFVMGGSTRYILMCSVECIGPLELGQGYQGYIVVLPSWCPGTRIIESETGAIIGDTVKEVAEDIKTGDPEVMEKQILDAKHSLATMRIERVTEEEFWKRIHKRDHE